MDYTAIPDEIEALPSAQGALIKRAQSPDQIRDIDAFYAIAKKHQIGRDQHAHLARVIWILLHCRHANRSINDMLARLNNHRVKQIFKISPEAGLRLLHCAVRATEWFCDLNELGDLVFWWGKNRTRAYRNYLQSLV